MSIVSLGFFMFLAFILCVYWACPVKYRWVVIMLSGAAFVLLGTGFSTLLFGVFILMTMAVWGASLYITKDISERRKTMITGLTIIAVAGTLIFYKEISFFIINGNLIGRLFGWNPGLIYHEIPAPFGISYFSLILIGYLLDVRWKTIGEPQTNPLKMIAFAGYFPHLVSGPFTRYNDIKGTLFGCTKFNYVNFCFGIQRILWGLFKKLVLADNLAPLVAGLYSGEPQGIIGVFAGSWLYVLQLYADFSGCMDIVIGTSQLFGIPLAENFRTPFYSLNLSEWWRRWHITLGFWLKDYVLYPVMKSSRMNGIRKFFKDKTDKKTSNRIATYLGMLVTWFSVGFWHGGSWKYICSSGLFFFVMIVGGLLLEPMFNAIIRVFMINTDCWSWRMFQRVRTFLLFSLSVSFGRSESLTAGVNRLIYALTNLNIAGDISRFIGWFMISEVKSVSLLAVLTAAVIALFVVSLLQEHRGSVRVLLANQNLVFRWGILIVLLFSVLIFGAYGPEFDAGAFIYQGF